MTLKKNANELKQMSEAKVDFINKYTRTNSKRVRLLKGH